MCVYVYIVSQWRKMQTKNVRASADGGALKLKVLPVWEIAHMLVISMMALA